MVDAIVAAVPPPAGVRSGSAGLVSDVDTTNAPMEETFTR
jgi:hypothetical protein